MNKKDDPKKSDKSQNSDMSFLSEEDKELWNKISDSTNPLDQKQRNRVSATEPLKQSPKKIHKADKTNKIENSVQNLSSKTQTANKPSKKSPEITQIDRKKIRKLVTEQIEIQATLDLHGYRQEEAHQALKSFIRTSQARNHRYVLVVTGKGSRKTSSQGFWDDIEPGVLKRNVPVWLSEPDLKDYIVSYSTAQPKHGGDGALYIHIRKAKKPV